MAEKYKQKNFDGFDEAPEDDLLERLARMAPEVREEVKQQALEHLNRAEQLIHAVNRLNGYAG